MMENPIKMDDLGVPLFLETPISLCKPPIRPFARYLEQNQCGFFVGGGYIAPILQQKKRKHPFSTEAKLNLQGSKVNYILGRSENAPFLLFDHQ